MCKLIEVTGDDMYAKLRTYYRMYVHEIRRLEEHVKPHETESELESADSTSGRTDYFIVDEQTGKIIGFLLLGKYPNAFSRHDIFIGEFYICPEHRRHGYGTQAVQQLLALYPDYDISMFVLKKNLGAKLFWNRILSEQGYVERTGIGDIKARTKNCEWFYWARA